MYVYIHICTYIYIQIHITHTSLVVISTCFAPRGGMCGQWEYFELSIDFIRVGAGGTAVQFCLEATQNLTGWGQVSVNLQVILG